MVWGELFLHCEEQLGFACFRAPDHPTQSFRSREQRLEKCSSRMAVPWGLPHFEMGLSRSADLVPAVGLVLKPSQTSPGLHSAAVGWVAAWGALAVGPVLEQQEIIFAWAVAAGLSCCKLLLCGRACAHTSVVANMGCRGQSMKNSGCSFLHGKGSFEQRCVFLGYAGHFFGELKFSDIAKQLQKCLFLRTEQCCERKLFVFYAKFWSKCKVVKYL